MDFFFSDALRAVPDPNTFEGLIYTIQRFTDGWVSGAPPGGVVESNIGVYGMQYFLLQLMPKVFPILILLISIRIAIKVFKKFSR